MLEGELATRKRGHQDMHTKISKGTLVENKYHYTPRTSRSPPASKNLIPTAKYQELSFQGFLKCTKIEDNNLQSGVSIVRYPSAPPFSYLFKSIRYAF